MKIKTINSNTSIYEKRKEELFKILGQPSYKEKRPCAACTKLCTCVKQSPHCTCCCSPDCPDAPRMLSSDPVQYPIEPKVVSIVFSLSELRMVQPCWSCEGHLRKDGSFVREPQVWFYSDSTLYTELLATHLADLHFKRLTKNQWIIKVSSHSECNSTTFMIYPGGNGHPSSNAHYLANLQDDIQIIANSLRTGIFKLANSKLKQYY